MERRALPLDGRHILVVEDDFLLAQSLRDALEEAGAVVLGPAARVRQALDLIARHAAALDGAVRMEAREVAMVMRDICPGGWRRSWR